MSAEAPLSYRGTGWGIGLVRFLLISFLVILGAAGTAQAHAVVTGSEPTDGAVLTFPPSEVTIRFSEPVSLTQSQVLDPNGENILEPAAAQGGDAGLRFELPGSLAEGTYIVSYHVVSLDGHPIAGSLIFSVGQVSSAAPAQDAGTPEMWRWTFVAAHAVLYLGMFGAAGGVIYKLLAKPAESSRETTRRIVAGSALLGFGAALVTLGIQGGLLMGGPARILLDPATWQAGMVSTFGRTALCAMLGLALIWLGSRPRRPAASEPLRLLGALLVLGSFAFSGHVITAGPQGITTPILLLHVAVTALWVGSLLPLYRALKTPVAEVGPLLGRFSHLAIWAVPVLILAGFGMAWLQIRHPEALIATEYGRLFLVKMALAAALLGLATLNRFRLTPALVRGDNGAVTRLGNSILAEIGLVLAIFAVTASLGTTPPPRALVSGSPEETSDLRAHHEHGPMHHGERQLQLSGRGFEAVVAFAPGQVGANTATITLQDAGGQPFEALEVTLHLSNPDRGIAPIERPAEREDMGRWHIPDLVIGTTGTWEVELDVLISDFERQTIKASLDLE